MMAGTGVIFLYIFPVMLATFLVTKDQGKKMLEAYI